MRQGIDGTAHRNIGIERIDLMARSNVYMNRRGVVFRLSLSSLRTKQNRDDQRRNQFQIHAEDSSDAAATTLLESGFTRNHPIAPAPHNAAATIKDAVQP